MSASKRTRVLLLAGGCIVLAGWGGASVTASLLDARRVALLEAEHAIVQTATPLIQQQRIPDRLVQAVQMLMDDRALGLSYLTLRNAADVTLVSRGRMGDTFSWLPMNQARQWRGWLYQLRSVEDNRPLMRGERRVGYARYGISWGNVVSRAGSSVLVGALAMVLGMCGCLVALRRLARPAPMAVERTSVCAASASESASAKSVRTPPFAVMPRKRRAQADFVPIPKASYARQPVPPDNASAGVSSTISSESPAALIGAPGENGAPSAPVAPPRESIMARASVSSQSAGMITSDAGTATEAVTEVPEFHAPRADVEPQPGDSNLDVRFYPIWRDDRRILTGAYAALAWRTAGAGLVDATTLIQLAERDGALRAFTQWIARRFSLLHGNWRTLELATVPILLPVPNTMLAFTDAEAVWRDALRRIDRDPNDLILRLNQRPMSRTHALLPIRRAFALDSPDGEVPDNCDLLCVDPNHVEGRAEAWRDCLDRLSCPMLLGPIADVSRWRALITHERVRWFSAAAENLYSPRSFGRLLSRYSVEPL